MNHDETGEFLDWFPSTFAERARAFESDDAMKFQCKVFDPADPPRDVSFTFAHWKRDGHFTNIIKSDDNKLSIWSSAPKNITDCLRWHPDYSRWQALPPGTSLYGELWLPGSSASEIKTAINARNASLRFDVFAVARHWHFQPQQLEGMQPPQLQRLCESMQLQFVYAINTFQIDHLLSLPLPEDVEGYVFKSGNLTDWYKWKPIKTIDLIVSGSIPGEGKYAGQIGSLICQTCEGFEIACVSGMDDAQRKAFTAQDCIGIVIEVAYQGVGAGGRLRFPRFVRVRDDKNPSECEARQDVELFNYWTM